MKILITGGAGNIGSALADKLIQNPTNYVVIVDNLLTGYTRNLPATEYKNWKFIKADVNNYSEILPIMVSHSFDYVFHYAAVVGVSRTLRNPLLVLSDIEGIKNILNLSKNTGVKRVFYSSSSEVYGEPIEFPQNEKTTPLNSRLNYAVVKNIGECFLKTYEKEFNLSFGVFRFFNTYGPAQSDDFVLPKFIHCAFRNEDITVYGDGSQTRTFCYIDDNIDTVIKIMNENLCLNEIINIGNEYEVNMKDLAELVISITKSSSRIVYLPPLEEGDMTRRLPDNSKMKMILNRELTPLDEGIKKLIKIYTSLDKKSIKKNQTFYA